MVIATNEVQRNIEVIPKTEIICQRVQENDVLVTLNMRTTIGKQWMKFMKIIENVIEPSFSLKMPVRRKVIMIMRVATDEIRGTR